MILDEYLGRVVKVMYDDGGQVKFARGVLSDLEGGFLKVVGDLGTIVISISCVRKVGLYVKNG